MKIISSYGVEIRKADGGLSLTLKIYREAVRVLSLFYDTVWEELSAVEGKMRRFNFAEHLVHSTKKNRAVHDFDMRRARLRHAFPENAVVPAQICHYARVGRGRIVQDTSCTVGGRRKEREGPGPRGENACDARILPGRHVQGRRGGHGLSQAL